MDKEMQITEKELIESLIIKKNNTLTDGYIPNSGKAILPDKLINALYWKLEQEGTAFKMTMVELRSLLGLKHGKDDERIYKAIAILQTPIQIRDFTFKGEDISWLSAPFLQRALKRKENQNFIDIILDEMMVEALKQKNGYTAMDIEICNQFKTKYGLKIYEMYLRYYRLPNREGKEVGAIKKTIEYLNQIFGTTYKTQSEMKRGIDRGIKEIEKITGELISCFFHKAEKKFIFGWHQKEKYPKLRIPYKRIDEFIDWYLTHNKELKINSILKYKSGLKKKILEDEFNDLDSFYRGMLKWKYNLNPSDFFDVRTGMYRDF
jgi:hypothetical protein